MILPVPPSSELVLTEKYPAGKLSTFTDLRNIVASQYEKLKTCKACKCSKNNHTNLVSIESYWENTILCRIQLWFSVKLTAEFIYLMK